MSPRPDRATPPPEPAGESDTDELAERLRSMEWPEPDAETRARLLKEFQQRVGEREPARPRDEG